jgi:hypothetical protein
MYVSVHHGTMRESGVTEHVFIAQWVERAHKMTVYEWRLDAIAGLLSVKPSKHPYKDS